MNPFALLKMGHEYGNVFVLETIVLMVIIVSLFLLFGAMAAGIPDVTFVKAGMAAVLMVAVQWIFAIGFSFIPFIGGFLGFIASILGMVYILKITFNTQWGTAFTTLAFAIVAELTTGVIIDLYLGIGLTNFANQFLFLT